jgi:hypothetical protein
MAADLTRCLIAYPLKPGLRHRPGFNVRRRPIHDQPSVRISLELRSQRPANFEVRKKFNPSKYVHHLLK